jgi:hypothetical protein
MKNRVTPEQMNVIVNIQMMKNKIDPAYDWTKHYKRLHKLSVDELRAEQERLIPLYNEAVKNEK